MNINKTKLKLFAYWFVFFWCIPTMMMDVLCCDVPVLIMTYVYNRPDFIKLHKLTFDNFLRDSYEYVVFNDASDENMRIRIEQTCIELGIRCVRVPQHLHNVPGRASAGHRHMDGIKYSLDTVAFDHDGIVLIIDADMFLLKPLNITEYMKGCDVIGGKQTRADSTHTVTYIAPTLVFMDMRSIPNKRTVSFEGGHIEGLACDVGGHWHYYFLANPTARIKLFTVESSADVPHNRVVLQNMGFDEHAIRFILSFTKPYGFEYHGDRHFMHYYAGGSNWPGYSAEYISEKNNLIYNYINELIEYYSKKCVCG
jgi:glycosyltransferase involved in cell wall biosynthesis